jgi:cell division protease FtsH
MMAAFPWVPFGIDAPDNAKVGRLLFGQDDFQLVQDQTSDRSVLLSPDTSAFAARLRDIAPDADHSDRVGDINYADECFFAATFEEIDRPVRVANIPKERTPRAATELLSLAAGIIEVFESGDDFSWGDMLYLPEYGRCIPTSLNHDDENRHVLAISLLTGGIQDTSLSASQLHAVNPWISVDEINAFLRCLGFQVSSDERSGVETPRAPGHFSLPGRPMLEEFFREYVIDHYWQKDRYEALGVKPPGGILLYGPPGTGKTFAVRELSKFLGWPVFDIDMGKVGSPYIHQTSLAIHDVFESAFEKAPSLIFIDEVDALVDDRNRVGHEHKIEEVSEFLRLIESASDRGVIVFGMTNRKEAIDDAMKRRGRFDHLIEVGYPELDEIVAVVENLLSKRPHVGGMNLRTLAEKLVRRPMSDIAWVVNESARLAVKSEKEQIDDICLFQAISKLQRK